MAWTLADLEEKLLIGSTLVEGSTLSEDEARQVLAGRTITGHPVHEHRELLGYRAAVEWLMRELAKSPFLSLDLVTGFHRILLGGLSANAGQLKTSRNFTYRSDGTRHEYLPPDEVQGALLGWIDEYNRERQPDDDAAERAGRLYLRFEDIHPFDDGNGRVGRILLAYWLHWRAGVGFVFRASDRVEHLEALESANRGDLGPLTAFVRARMEPER